MQKREDRQTNTEYKFKLGEIKCCKEIKITSPPNEWRNIPFDDMMAMKFVLSPAFDLLTTRTIFVSGFDRTKYGKHIHPNLPTVPIK